MGDGPKPARVFCLGEAPGREEDLTGIPFKGQAGREFNENYLPLAGLDRADVYISNTVKCRPDLNRKPRHDEVVGCSSHWLPGELAEVGAEVVVLMGATACSLVPGLDLEAEHGIPRLGELYGWSGWMVPMYHPASGLHDTSMMTPLLEDWERLRGWLESGAWVWPVESREKDYALLDSSQSVDDFFHRYVRKRENRFARRHFLVGGDTESHAGVPYSWQVSLEDNVARMVMLDNKEASEALAAWLCAGIACDDIKFVFHYAPADLPIFEQQLGCSLDGLYRDTMLEAYGFGNYGRLGLKMLARRVLGRSRLSWEETVTPYSKEVLAQWMMNGFVYSESEWQTTIPRFHKTSNKPLKPSINRSLPEKLLPELLKYSLGNSEYPIWQKLYERLPVEWMEKLIDACGPVPQKGIAHCPLDVQVEYACLSKETKVVTEQGPINIGDLVRDKSTLKVLSANTDQQLEYKPIVGWHRVVHDEPIRWFSVRTDISRPTRWGFESSRYTSDHKLLTVEGYKEIRDLQQGDVLLHPTKALNSVQKQIVLGSLLGDGTLGHRNQGGWAVLTFSNNERQLGYVCWKKECLSDLVNGPVVRRGSLAPRKIAGRWTSPSQFYGISTIAHPEIVRLRHASYPIKGIKRVAEWVEELEPLALAVWFMDDGTRVRNKDYDQAARFYTNSYPKYDVEQLCHLMSSKFGYEPSMFQMNKQWVMALNSRTSNTFFEQIAEFVPDCMQYKLPPHFRGRFKGIPIAYSNGLVRSTVIEVYKNTPKRRGSGFISYCIDVQANHNFATLSEIAHNCSDPDDTRQLAVEFDRMRKEFVASLNMQDEDVD